MYRLRTLGGSDLRSTEDGRHVQSVLAQPKRFALLVYLAVERPGGFTRRDVLLDLFWPEFDQARARAALRKSLHYLRSSLGPKVLVRRGDEEVGIDRDRLWCDVVAFEEFVGAGDLEKALELYGGSFLPGFHLGGVPGFEGWLDRQRARLRREADRAARELAGTAAAAGDPAEVVSWARRALEIDPYDEVALRRLLERVPTDSLAEVRIHGQFDLDLPIQVPVADRPDSAQARLR